MQSKCPECGIKKSRAGLKYLVNGYGRMELFELLILKYGDLNLKACAFEFLIVLFLCYNILFCFNLCSSLAVTNELCTYIIKHQY